MLRFGRRKTILGRGYVLLIGGSIFGAGITDSNYSFALGLTLVLIVLTDSITSRRRPALTLALALPQWLEAEAATPVGLKISQSQQQSVLVHGGGPVHLGENVFASGDASGETTLTVSGRGVLEAIPLSVLVEGMIGIGGTKHAVELELPTPLPVGPIALAEPEIDAFIDQLENDVAEPAILGVRPYSAGDRRRDVHWRSTARTGELMVRERLRVDPDVNRPVVVSALTENPVFLERALARARHAATRCVALGFDTHLEVARLDGSRVSPVSRKVGTEVEIMELLAAAMPSNASPLPRPPGSAAIMLGRATTCIPHG